MNRRSLCVSAVALVALVAGSFSSFAQERQGGGPGGNFDPAQFRERMLNDLKERLAASDEEWTVLKPKIEKVQTAQMAALGGRFGGMRGGDRGRGGDSNRQRSAAEQASRDLRDALENKDTPAETITAKLTALREARAKAKTELETAQKDLQSVLTPRQEAVLVAAGTLE
jgi:hypothetical protein